MKKRKTFIKRFISMLMVAIMFVTAMPQISAASAVTRKLPSLSSSLYIKTYTLASSGKIYAYSDSNLKTKLGNAYYIDCEKDECYIIAISGDAVKVSYPSGSGRSTRWFKRSDFTSTKLSTTGSFTVKTATAKFYTYTRSDGKTKYGYVDKGDVIYILSSSNGYTQIIFPITATGVWEMAWVKTSTLNSSTKDVTKTAISKCTITLSSTTCSYTGSAIEPTVTVKNGSTTLISGTDYTVSYSNNTNVGTGKVTITGTGIYSGSVSKTFTIKKANNTITASDVTKTVSSSKRSFSLDAKVNGGAKLTYSSSNSKVTVNSSGKVTIPANWTGTVTITIKAAATTNYNAATKKITVTVSKSAITTSAITTNYKGTSKDIVDSDYYVTVNGTKITAGDTFYTYSSSGSGKTVGTGSGKTFVLVNNVPKQTSSWQCCAFARYVQFLLYGRCDAGGDSAFTSDISNVTINSKNKEKIMNAIIKAGAGAHIRIKKSTSGEHSVVVISADEDGFYYVEANTVNKNEDKGNQISLGYYTYDSFIQQSNYNNGYIIYIRYYKG